MSWSPYPSEPKQRTSTITKDTLVVALLAFLAWLGTRVYSLVNEVDVITEAVQGAGSSVQNGFGAAADAVSGTPVIGDDIAGALQAAGDASGGNVVDLALTGERAITQLAWGLGLLTFAIPAAILLALYLPVRIAQLRRLRGSRLVFREPADPERRRLLAERAAFSLPVDHLVRYTPDPLGDLLRADYDALVAALLEDAGLAPPQPPAALAGPGRLPPNG